MSEQEAAEKICEAEETVETAQETSETGSEEISDLQTLENQLAAEKDARRRLAAEYDNFRKRSAREKEALLGEAFSMAVSAFLPLIDNVERAVSFADCNAESVREGVLLMEKQMREIAQKIQLEPIDPAGEPFDPTLHEAVLHIQDEAFGENTVAEVLQKGWRIGEKIIRFAMVKVAN